MLRIATPIVLSVIAIMASVIASDSGPMPSSAATHPVQWLDDVDTALAQSKASGKPILALLHNTPECPRCQAIWHELSVHPLLAEALADAFVALRLGRRQYNALQQPRQSLLFLDETGKPLMPRSGQARSTDRLATRMIQALQAANRPVPRYLHAMAMEQDAAKHKRAAFAMFCYWVGEYELGKIDGVISTEAGWLEGREVTLVRYHQDQLTLPELAQKAAEIKCARKVFAPTAQERHELQASSRLTVGTLDARYRTAKPSDQKKQIQHWNLAAIAGLTPIQLTKLNAFAPDDPKRALDWLSPRQRRALTSVSSGRARVN